MKGVEVRIAAGTERGLPDDIMRTASRVVDEATGEVRKDRGTADEPYSTVITLGPGRTDFAVRGAQDSFVGKTVESMWAEWTGRERMRQMVVADMVGTINMG